MSSTEKPESTFITASNGHTSQNHPTSGGKTVIDILTFMVKKNNYYKMVKRERFNEISYSWYKANVLL